MITVTWLGQAGYLLDLDGLVLCIDPYLSDIVFEAEQRPRMIPPPVLPEQLSCQWFLSTHDHLDHLDPVTVEKMDRTRVTFAGPSSCIEHFKRLGIGEEQLVTLDRGQTITIDEITLEAVFADHTEDSIGVAVRYGDRCLYFVGDSLYRETLGDELDRVDALFVCINGKLGNMTASQAAALAEKLRPCVAIPNHYGMFSSNTADLCLFIEEMKRAGLKPYAAKPGIPFNLDEIMKG